MLSGPDRDNPRPCCSCCCLPHVSVAMRSPRIRPSGGPGWWPVKSPHPSLVVSAWFVRPGRRRWRCQPVTSTAQGASIEVCEGSDGHHFGLPSGRYLPGAAAISGTTPKTVRRVIARHEAGGGAPVRSPRVRNYDAVAALVGRHPVSDHRHHRCDREAQPPDAWQASHDVGVRRDAFVGHESMLAVADVYGTIHEPAHRGSADRERKPRGRALGSLVGGLCTSSVTSPWTRWSASTAGCRAVCPPETAGTGTFAQ